LNCHIKATPFPGLSAEEEQWSAFLKSREDLKRKEGLIMEEKAQMLDSNETIREEAWKKGKH
jgi:hypothetical protein